MSGSNIAFIPFRSGSTRLPDKNILPLADLPLAAWSLVAANKCENIDKIILSTDHEEFYSRIVSAAREVTDLKKDILFDHRAPEHSGSKVKIFDYIKYNMKQTLVKDCDNLIQLLPTSPFRRISTIQEALKLYLDTGVGRFAAAEYDFRVSFAFSLDEDSFTPLFEDCPMITGDTQSQSHPAMYHPCGVFNIFNMGKARREMNTIYDGCKPVIVSREESFDIDTPEDFLFMGSIANVFKSRLLAS
jgi:CMP-N-acetylneuraminic acid synthetase